MPVKLLRETVSEPRLLPRAAGIHASERIRSIDVLRGVTILLMIFVNDVAGVAGVPGWMKHLEPADADGMTFVDVIFPAFLFIVGMSIPFALERRMAGAASAREVWWHILIRTVSLLVIGVFMVNSGDYVEGGVIPRAVWALMMYTGVMLVWARIPADVPMPELFRKALLPAGIILLLAAALLFRGPAQGVIALRPQWWGILGLIGWAYFVGSATYVLVRRRIPGLIGAVALLYLLYVADAGGAFDGMTWITGWLSVGSMLGSHAAITVSGMVLGVVLMRDSKDPDPARRIRWAVSFGLVMAVAAMLLHAARDVHPMFIINKIYATPPWCLWSAALTAWTWAAIYWWLDVRGHERGTRTVALSGQNALLAYILAPVVYAVFEVMAATFNTSNVYWILSGSFWLGFGRAVLLAGLICFVTAALRRKGFVLKL